MLKYLDLFSGLNRKYKEARFEELRESRKTGKLLLSNNGGRIDMGKYPIEIRSKNDRDSWIEFLTKLESRGWISLCKEKDSYTFSLTKKALNRSIRFEL